MIQKIKELMEVNEKIDVIKNNLSYTTNAVSAMREELDSFKQSLTNHETALQQQKEEINNDLTSIKSLRVDFEKELFEFKLLKSQLQKKVLDQFQEQVNEELKKQTESLTFDAEQYNAIKENMFVLTNKVNQLSGELDKFTAISKSIKQGDFELTKYARNLVELDKEKLDLMRKIDNLERLVSKMRRHNPVMQR